MRIGLPNARAHRGRRGSLPAGAGSAGRAGLRRSLEARAGSALGVFVHRSGDRRLERTLGTRQGLRMLFAAMQARFVPAGTGGFTGDLLFELRGGDGRIQSWTVTITPDRAIARLGRPAAPRLILKLTVADFIRLAGRDLDAGNALLIGRIDLVGDFAVAARLGEMFGQKRI